MNTNRIALVPYAFGGVGSMWFTWYEPNNRNNNIARSSGGKGIYGLGTYCDIKFSDRSALYKITGRKISYSSLRLRYQFGMADYRLPGIARSGMHTVSVEWGGLSRSFRPPGR